MLSVSDVREHTLTFLGASALDIEVSEGDVDACLKQAIRLLNRYLPKQDVGIIESPQQTQGLGTAGGSKHRLDDKHPGIIAVVDCEFSPITQIEGGAYFENPFVYSPVRSAGGESAGTYGVTRAYYEDGRRVFSADPEWYTNHETVANATTGELERHLYLYLSLPEYTSQFWRVMYRYNYQYTPDDDPYTGVGTIRPDLEEWVFRYVEAQAKIILSRIRGKFGGVVETQGAFAQLDAMNLQQEAQQDLYALEEDLRSRQRPIPPLFD